MVNLEHYLRLDGVRRLKSRYVYGDSFSNDTHCRERLIAWVCIRTIRRESTSEKVPT